MLDGRIGTTFGDLVDLLGDQTVCLPVHVRCDVSRRGVDETEDLPGCFVDPVAEVADAVRSLGPQIGVVGPGHVAEGDGIVQRVDVEEQWHGLVLFACGLPPTLESGPAPAHRKNHPSTTRTRMGGSLDAASRSQLLA